MRRMTKILSVLLGTQIMFLIAFSAWATESSTDKELNRELLFTIPWGDKWGELKYLSSKQLMDARYDGPSAMSVSPTDEIYIYDPGTRRLQKFSSSGKLLAGAAFEQHVPEITLIALGTVESGGDRPIAIADNAGYIGLLRKLSAEPTTVNPVQLFKDVFTITRTTVYRLGAINPGGLFIEDGGMFDPLPFVQQYDGDAYRRRFEVVDLVSWDPWYYALAIDRTGNELYKTATGALVIQEIDAYEGRVSREIPITPPPLTGTKQSRWHLIGAGAQSTRPTFYLAENWPLLADDQIFAVSDTNDIVGMARVAVPAPVEDDKYFKSWNHLASVSQKGDLYLGIPVKKGFAIMKYRLVSVNPPKKVDSSKPASGSAE